MLVGLLVLAMPISVLSSNFGQVWKEHEEDVRLQAKSDELVSQTSFSIFLLPLSFLLAYDRPEKSLLIYLEEEDDDDDDDDACLVFINYNYSTQLMFFITTTLYFQFNSSINVYIITTLSLLLLQVVARY